MSIPLYFFAVISFLFLSSYGDTSNNTSSATCSSSDCGNGVSIRYPFWVANSTTTVTTHHFCGYPDFGLTCSHDGQPIITLPSTMYYVTDIDYDASTLTLVDIDVVNQSCPRARHNVTLGTLPFIYNNLDLNLSFYFNCSLSQAQSKQQSLLVPSNPIDCLKSSEASQQSYVFETGNETVGYDWSRDCEENVVVAVKKDEIAGVELASGFGEAMNKGFVLDWQRAVDCIVCEDSDGYCGFRETTNQMLCFCKDGRIGANRCVTDNSRSKLIIGVTIGAIAALLICVILSYCIMKFRRATKVDNEIEAFIGNHGPLALTRYKFSDVKKMTKFFKVKLGQGGYGTVYKGELLNGCSVAVKMLTSSKGNCQDFINEVASISRTSHVNVVSLLGFSLEGRKKALIYKFMPNGSLDKFIYKKADETGLSLGWENLYQIALGIARGLEYLHRGCNTRILHFDIKPHNILLDESFCPKISDFGLAKLCPQKESIISISDARGTIGYLAPEVWNRNIGGVSHKSDVYSYGMLLLDMAGGRQNMNNKTSCTTEIYFPDWIYDRLEQDRNLGRDGMTTAEEHVFAKKMTIVGLWCIQTFPSHRPTMSRVIEMLEGSLGSLEMPPRPVMSSSTRIEQKSSTAPTY